MTFTPPSPPPLTGSEPFDGLDARVLDFWRFALSDLRTNNVRGHLAEFLVARAVGVSAQRVEWDPWDVQTPDGITIEVKASGYLQAWTQRKLSTPTYRVAPAHGWDSDTGASSPERQYNADVYVFCLQTARTHQVYDPLDVSQWEFYVLGRASIVARPYLSMGLATLRRLARAPIGYGELATSIYEVAARERNEPGGGSRLP